MPSDDPGHVLIQKITAARLVLLDHRVEFRWIRFARDIRSRAAGASAAPRRIDAAPNPSI
jgi:hypothetical protein